MGASSQVPQPCLLHSLETPTTHSPDPEPVSSVSQQIFTQHLPECAEVRDISTKAEDRAVPESWGSCVHAYTHTHTHLACGGYTLPSLCLAECPWTSHFSWCLSFPICRTRVITHPAGTGKCARTLRTVPVQSNAPGPVRPRWTQNDAMTQAEEARRGGRGTDPGCKAGRA